MLSKKNPNLNKKSKYKMYLTLSNTIIKVLELKELAFIQTELHP